jgi:hypothetical protein
MDSTHEDTPDTERTWSGPGPDIDQRIRLRSTASGVDIYGRVSRVDEAAVEVETFDRSNSLVSLDRGSEAEVAAFDAADMTEYPVRVIEDSGKVVRVSSPPRDGRLQRRAHPRTDCSLAGELGAGALLGGRLQCRILNIGLGGLLLACPRSLPIGSRLELAFSIPGASRRVVSAVDVIWEPEAQSGEEYHYGCAFARLDMDDAVALGDYIVGSL